ncbi:MAG: SMC-Scp complex subunit ScpB [Candidatus Doudnabacteria bacterium]|nr:SMC-Scp complex subunit ScpB [Candidatus Doudnabacteria bacterium]
MKNLISKIQSILFAAGRPIKIAELTKVLGVDRETAAAALAELGNELTHSGINLISHEDKYQLVSNPENAKILSEFLNSELREKLTDASVETLAIVLYKQPISRAEIESIRGVNSQYTLRQLQIRGLIEKSASPEDGRRLVYRTTLDFMRHMGITDLKQLPDFEQLISSVTVPEPNVGRFDSAADKDERIDHESTPRNSPEIDEEK